MDMNIQKYLRAGKTLDELHSELGIKSRTHDKHPLVILDYTPMSPKTDSIVRECRGIVLELGTWDLIAKSFDRFFNLGEFPELDESVFNWNHFHAQEKVDGSILTLFNYNDEWIIKTSASWAGRMDNSPYLYQELFWRYCGFDPQNLNKKYSYVFEFCSKYNRVVRVYNSPQLFTLGIWEGNIELPYSEVVHLVHDFGLPNPPQTLHLHSLDEVRSFLLEKEKTDPTYEGVILRDDKNLRLKIKTQTYLALHHTFNNGAVFDVKNIVKYILSGEISEILSYWPEAEELVIECKGILDLEFAKLECLWDELKEIPSQKDFAAQVLDKARFPGILFEARKRGTPLEELWRDRPELLYNHLFKAEDEKRSFTAMY